MTNKAGNKGFVVTGAGTGINLALGVLYTWSIFKSAIKSSIDKGGEGAFTWDPATLNDPYALCCLVFAFGMILAGKVQDRFGPMRTAITGGVLVGAGFILISQSNLYAIWILGFGCLVGLGMAFGYSSATPPALKWFPPNKSGRIAGIVVSGFGLASVYIAPLAQYLMKYFGLSRTMMFFGVGFFLVVTLFSFFLVNPPDSYIPKGFVDRRCRSDNNRQARSLFGDRQLRPSEVVKTAAFWRIWMLYFIGSGAGLMVIGSIAGMAKSSLGTKAFLAVAILAVGNAAGRIVAGMLADKMGRAKTLAGVFTLQAVMMFGAVSVIGNPHQNPVLLVALATIIGFNYGANLALFPTFAKDLWGMKHFGANYGILFTAWGVGGFVMSKLSEALRAGSSGYTASFLLAGAMLAGGVLLIVCKRDEKEEQRKKISRQRAASSAG